jgi:hypothetical protein
MLSDTGIKIRTDGNVNWKNMHDLWRFIDFNVSASNFAMESFSNFVLEVDADDQVNPWCQTAACIAGWAFTYQYRQDIAKAIPQIILRVQDDIDNIDDDTVDIEYDIIKECSDATDNYYQVGQQFLGLDDQQADELFYADPPFENVWWLYREELDLDFNENGVVMSRITKNDALMLMEKLMTGEWNFYSDE